MDTGRERMSARVVTLMSQQAKADLKAKAQAAGMSVGEFVRRAVEAYDPEEARQIREIAALFRSVELTTH